MFGLRVFVIGPVTAEMHTETTVHEDSRVNESPAIGFSTDLAGVNADVHNRTTVETDAIASSSVDDCLSSGSSVHDVELTGFTVSNISSLCCSVSGSLDFDIPFFRGQQSALRSAKRNFRNLRNYVSYVAL